MYDDIAKSILNLFAKSDADLQTLLSSPMIINKISDFASILENRFGQELPPLPTETTVFTLKRPKTAALSYDKVYRIPILPDPVNVPQELGFYCATKAEVEFSFFMQVIAAHEDGKLLSLAGLDNNDFKTKLLGSNHFDFVENFFSELNRATTHGIVVLLPDRADLIEREKPNSQELISVSLENLGIVSEDKLEWPQVVEFRKDEEAKVKYRRFLNWIEKDAKFDNQAQFEDLLAIKLDDYQWSLKKHGVETVSGVITKILDPKFMSAATVASAGPAVFAGTVWGALVASGIMIGKVGAEAAKISLDLEENRRGSNYEVAYVHEIKEKLSK